MTTVPQLRRALSRYQFGSEAGEAGGSPDPAGRDERDVPGTEAFAAKAPELSMSYGDGRFLLRYSAPADIGALVEQAVREAKDALFTGGQTAASYADGLAEMASRSLASVRSGSRAARYRVYVHLSTDGSWVGGRGAIPASLAAKFACDGMVQPVWEVDGTPVSVGRKQRIVPRPDSPPRRGPRPRLRVPGLPGHRVPRDPPPRPLGRRRRDRPGPARMPVPAPPRRSPPRRVHHQWLPDPPRPVGSADLWCRCGAGLHQRSRPGHRPLPSDPLRRGPSRESRSSTHTEDPPVSGCRPAGWTCAPTDPH